MKTRIMILASLTGFFLLSPQITTGQNLPEVIALRNLHLRKGTNPIIFQNYYKHWCEKIRDNSKGACGWIMYGDRGANEGQYCFAWGFNFQATRDYYFPESDQANYPQWNAVLEKFHFRPPTAQLVDSISDYTDFVVIGYNSMIDPQLGQLICLSYFDVAEGRQENFERFVSYELQPAFQKDIDGFRIYVLKGDRGSLTGKYVLFRVFDSVDLRNNYFPEGINNPAPDFAEKWSMVESLYERLQNYMMGTTVPTEYIVVR